MSIVAISETAGSLGNEVGRRLAERLGYRFADREIIAKASERFGESVTDLRHAAEEKPTLWERLTDTQHRYKLFVEAIILEMAGGDNVVLAGLASAIVCVPSRTRYGSAPMRRSGSGPTACSNSKGSRVRRPSTTSARPTTSAPRA